jgi:hypothetical protein
VKATIAYLNHAQVCKLLPGTAEGLKGPGIAADSDDLPIALMLPASIYIPAGRDVLDGLFIIIGIIFLIGFIA